MRRLIIAGLLAVTVLVVGAALILPQILSSNSSRIAGDDAALGAQAPPPELRIAIASRESLIALVEEKKEIASSQRACEEQSVKLAEMIGSRNAEEENLLEGETLEPSSDVLNLQESLLGCHASSPALNESLIAAMSNKLESQLSGDIAKSNRLDVVEPSTTLAAFENVFSKSDIQQRTLRELAALEEKASGEDKKSLQAALAGEVRNFFDQSGEGNNPNTALATDFSKIAKELGVGYFLFVDLYEPGAVFDFVGGAYGGERKFVLRANPLFVYRLYDVQNQRVLLSSQERLANGFTIDINRSAYSRLVAAGFGSDATRHAFDSILGESAFERMNSVSALIARAVLDEISPAQIASKDQETADAPVIITRGGNDGVAVGDTFEVRQFVRDANGNPVETIDPSTGKVLDRPTVTVGRLRVTEVLPASNSATAERVGSAGTLFRTGDILIPDGGALAQAATSSVAAPAISNYGVDGAGQLGTIGERDHAARIAVRPFDIRGLSETYARRALDEAMALALTRRLSSDRRYQVVDRRALDLLQEEFDLATEVSGRVSAGQRAPVSIAGYLVTGLVNIEEEETRRSVSLRGQSQSLPSTFTLRASGEIRILDSRSNLVTATQVSVSRQVSRSSLGDSGALGALADAFAAEAAKLLRTELYPLKIAQVSSDGKRFSINGGADVGLEKNTLLNVFSLGEPIIDPDTRTVLSAGARSLIGTLEVTEVSGPVSTAVDHSLKGATPSVGDIVEVAGRVEARAPIKAGPEPAAATSIEEATDVPF